MSHLAKLCPLLLLVAACGGDSDSLPDAPPGGPDAMRADAPPAVTATVRVTQEAFEASPGTPIADAKVAVVAPGGGAPVVHTTDATGTSTFPLEAGSSVWVQVAPVGSGTLVPGVGSGSGHLYLITSVSPGDTINLGSPAPATGSAAGTLTVTYTPYAGGSFGSYHDAVMDRTPCYDYGTETVPGTIVFTTYDGCGAPTRDLVITSYDVTTGNPVAWLTVPGVSPVPGTVDATTLTWDTTGASYVANHTGQDPGVYYAYTSIVSQASWHVVGLNGGISLGTGTYSSLGPTMPVPVVVGTQLSHSSALAQFIAEPLAAVPATYTVDGANLLPFIQEASYDSATRTIHWVTAVAGTVAPQIVTSTFSFFDSADTTQYRWTIYAPGTTTELVIPDVPDELTTHDLHVGDFLYPDIWLIDVAGSSYSDLLTDLDLHRDDPAGSGYRPTSRNLLSGGYGGGK